MQEQPFSDHNYMMWICVQALWIRDEEPILWIIENPSYVGFILLYDIISSIMCQIIVFRLVTKMKCYFMVILLVMIAWLYTQALFEDCTHSSFKDEMLFYGRFACHDSLIIHTRTLFELLSSFKDEMLFMVGLHDHCLRALPSSLAIPLLVMMGWCYSW